jgi:hypothetical protein
MQATATSASNTTITISLPCAEASPGEPPCDWHEMHHLDDGGRHWCPTGYMFCHAHGGVGEITGLGVCQLWGEFPNTDG